MVGRVRTAVLVVLVLGAWSLVVPAANAYIDPGSGSIIIQAVAAAAMAVALSVRIWWRRISIFLSNLFRRSSSDSSDA